MLLNQGMLVGNKNSGHSTQLLLPARNACKFCRAPAVVGPKNRRQTSLISLQSLKRVEAEVCDEQVVPRLEAKEEDAQSPIADNAAWNVLKKLGRILSVGAICLALAFASANPALAAGSGGRTGGSAFGSARSSMGGGMSSGYSSRGLGSSSSSSIFGGSSRSSPLIGGNIARRSPSVGINSFGWYGAPMYGGYGYGVPVASSGGGFFNIIVLAAFAAIAYSVIRGGTNSDSFSGTGERVTVAKLQVGLLGSARQLQRDLDRIAGRADTNSPSGLHYILQETVLSLLRNPDYCIYGQGQTSSQRGLEAGEARFNALSMEERSKVKEETLVNVGGRTRRGSYNGSSSTASNELIVVTILVAAEGGLKLPKVTSLEELRSALNTLGGVSESQTLAVEVLWTPQDMNDHYTKDDMMHDFPTLNSL